MPRAELVAIIDLLACTQGDVCVYTDHKNIVTGYSRGPRYTVQSENCDLWEDLWEQAKKGQRCVTICKVPAHLDQPSKILEALQSHGPEVIVGNHVADALAGRAAGEAEVPQVQVDQFKALRRKAASVLTRAVAITIEAASLPSEHHRLVKPPRALRASYVVSLREAMRGSTHVVVPLGGRWRCTSCLGISPFRLKARWFARQCPGRGGTSDQLAAVSAPHFSHSMERRGDLVWCQVCGSWSDQRVSLNLMRDCPRRPSSAFHRYTLSRLRRGLRPLPAARGGEFTLGIV